MTDGLFFTDHKLNSCSGAIAGYKFYLFNPYGRENLFIHYSFQYLRYKGNYDTYYNVSNQRYHWKETDTYINNVIGVGYNLFFDMDERFGFFYTLDYVISQNGYKLDADGLSSDNWTMHYVWNNLSTHVGFSFKFTGLKKVSKR